TITSYLPEQATITTSSRDPGVLILSDMVFPGWQARVDNAPAPILTVDHALRGVYLPAGAHTTSFEYRPTSFLLGALISGLALLLLVGLAGWSALRLNGPGSAPRF